MDRSHNQVRVRNGLLSTMEEGAKIQVQQNN